MSSNTFTFGSNFSYPILRRLWINNQLQQVTDLLFFIDLAILEVGNNSLIIYNGAADYNDTLFENYIKLISSQIIMYENSYVIPWRLATASLNNYETVENGFKTFATATQNSIIDPQNPNQETDILILADFFHKMKTFYYKSDDNNATVMKTILMSADDLKVHLNIYKLIANAISNISSKLKGIRQFIFIVSQNDSTHPLYNTCQLVDESISSSTGAFQAINNLTNFIDKILINNLNNNVSNTITNYSDLSDLVNTVSEKLLNVHEILKKVFINTDNTDANYQYAIANSL
jgi:hypothetical protein